ncbi:hypothetical protein [Sphingomicrobium arenosum]|uniref:hypothetical protein n=1 Tax=Sphingomicrobium arenosum TaxID=2233861 RepID=UPI00223F6DBF|nr:hypothetical protein [Sphingomicrobium arenosum]
MTKKIVFLLWALAAGVAFAAAAYAGYSPFGDGRSAGGAGAYSRGGGPTHK